MSDGSGSDGGQAHQSPLRRTFDVCLVAPIGMAVSVVEEIPELITEGRRRLEMQLGNALFVGRFVVNQKQRELSARLDGLRGHSPAPDTNQTNMAGPTNETDETRETDETHETNGAGAGAPASWTPSSERRAPDPAAAAIVGGALADYDTLSASQVVRRLESLGPDQLDAVRRYEASTRNRRTILNRAGQLLDEQSSEPSEG